MSSRIETTSARNLLAMGVMAISLVLFQGCGKGGDDHSDDADHADTNAVGDQTSTEANHGGDDADKHDDAVEHYAFLQIAQRVPARSH